jgi:ZIP family zinc transporter
VTGLQNLHPVIQALLATCFTWAMTATGAATVFTAKDISRKVLDGMLGFAGGVMIAASYWSLLAPAIELSEGKSIPAWVPAVVGFLIGGIFLLLTDRILPHLHLGFPMEEGLAVGVAFGALATGLPSGTFGAAVALAVGIGIQNLPEGMAVSVPLRREGMSRRKSFWYGQLSGIVEPIAGVAGAGVVVVAQPLLPYALAFAAGAMIFVVIEEVIPEAQRGGHADLATMGGMIGFAVMMVLDVAFS